MTPTTRMPTVSSCVSGHFDGRENGQGLRGQIAAHSRGVVVVGYLHIAVQFVGMTARRFDLNREVTNSEFGDDQPPDYPENRFGGCSFLD